MLNIYFIDYYNKLNNNGLNSYTEQLTTLLAKKINIKLNIIWINSEKYQDTTNEIINDVTHIHVPINLRNEKNNKDVVLTNILTDNIGSKKNVIIHFNWINHLSLAWHLKQKMNAIFLLTKHCLPWRDFVTTNYNEFYTLNEAYVKTKKIALSNQQLKKEQLEYGNVHHIITVTNCAKFSLTHLFNISSKKTTVIFNGINPSIFKKYNTKSKIKLRRKYSFELNERILLFVGNVHNRKGIIDVVKTFDKIASNKDFENVRLIIVGPGQHSQVLETVKRHWSKITLTGSLDKITLYDFYAMADIGIMPSYVEQCSYTVIEMMHCKLPIIVSDIDGLKEMVNDDCGLKIKVNFTKTGASVNTKDLKEKINFLLENPHAAKRLAANAKKYALKHLTSERMVQETIAVYEKVLKENNENPITGKTTNLTLKEKDIKYPLVSIIMPCYNAEKYIKESIYSVLNQNYINFELILIDDGSTDSTWEMIMTLEDKRIIYHQNIKNAGIAFTLNKGIKLAKGKYIARLDADDEMLPDRLFLQVDFLEKNPDYGLVGAYHYVIDAQGRPIQKLEPFTTNSDLQLNLLFSNPFAHPVMTIRSNILKELNYDKTFANCEDYDLWFRISKKYKIKNLPIPLLNYRVHGQNISVINGKIMRQNVIKLLSRELDAIGIKHTPDELMTHAAISFLHKKLYFNTEERLKNLHDWLDKIFTSQKLTENNSRQKLRKFKKHILINYCGFH